MDSAERIRSNKQYPVMKQTGFYSHIISPDDVILNEVSNLCKNI